uniref:Uncharacterized protein n=1 Tax=Rhinopithecus roxellana TaxID=61622 RepID=A0A2K6NM99_RHIRO
MHADLYSTCSPTAAQCDNRVVAWQSTSPTEWAQVPSRAARGILLFDTWDLTLSDSSLCTYLCFVKCKSVNKHE